MRPCHLLLSPLLAIALLLPLLPACGDEDAAEGTPQTDTRTDAQLCAELCEEIDQTCPDAAEDLMASDPAACQSLCLDAEDSSTDFRRCMADATSCDDLATCKDMF